MSEPISVSEPITVTSLRELAQLADQSGQPGQEGQTGQESREVELSGWIDNKRSSGKIAFLKVRTTGGVVQAVASRADLSEAAWAEVERVTQESAVRLRGRVKADKRAPGGVEVQLTDFAVLSLTEDFPITPKEHGTAFLMEHRHLWLRSSRQHAVLRVRSEVEQAIRDFFYERDFTLIDSPILTACGLRGHLDAVRDRLLRRQGVPVAVRPALPRAGGGGVRQGLLLRPHLPGREVEDAPPPDRVLDGRARGRLPRVRGPLRARRGVRRPLVRAGCSTAAART